MKLEIRKETQPNGDVFYHVYENDRFLKGFWVGNHITNEQGKGEEKALSEAKGYYDRIKANNQSHPIIETILSEEI